MNAYGCEKPKFVAFEKCFEHSKYFFLNAVYSSEDRALSFAVLFRLIPVVKHLVVELVTVLASRSR